MREFGYQPSKNEASSNTSRSWLQFVSSKTRKLSDRYRDFSEQHPVLATVAETVALYAANEASKKVVERYGRGLKIGHGRESKQGRIFERYPIAATAVVTGPIPIFEEFFHRKIASDYLDHIGHKREMRWDVGIPQAVAFGASPQHLGKEAIPVPQFTFGLHAWRVQRQRGYPYAVLAHATYNALAAGTYINKAKGK